jgi:hypothetical protein
MTYSEKLQDPRWQKKRLEIMSRDGFQCVKCLSETNTLTVHHFYYVSGRMPWEYPGGAMATLCRKCHTAAHGNLSVPSFFSSWELSACFEIKRQIQLNHYEVDHDRGVLLEVEMAAHQAGWAPLEALHLLKAAAELGIMTEKWLFDLSQQAAEIVRQRTSDK